jgi:hypothetical protein
MIAFARPSVQPVDAASPARLCERFLSVFCNMRAGARSNALAPMHHATNVAPRSDRGLLFLRMVDHVAHPENVGSRDNIPK